jgi:FemAB-related protein (PEP-CTERM system-associated)
MIIRRATPNDAAAWDSYVAQHAEATPYHKFAWGMACEQAYRQSMHYLLAEDTDGKLIGILPAINFKRPLKGEQLVALPFCDTGFALADSQDIKTALLSHLSAQSDYRDLRQEPADTEALSPGQKVILRLPLPDSSEALLSQFKSKLRSQIRKAEKNGLTMKMAANFAQHQQLLDDFYNVYKQNMRQLASPVHSRVWFERILANYDDAARVCVVYTGELAIGAGIVLINGQMAAIPWASTLSEHNRLAPNMLLYWSLLANVTDNGQRLFDFGRSSFGEGTYKFKTQWGALPYALHWHDGTSADLEAAVETGPPGTVRQLAETIWPRLPLGLTVSMGSAIRRYISL